MNYLIILLLLPAACVSQRQQVKQKTERRHTVQQDYWQYLQQHTWQKDSSGFGILIAPRDSFQLHAAHGFQGKADWIYWTGRQERLTIASDSQSQGQQLKSAVQWQSKQSESKQKKSYSTSPLWLVGAAVVLLLIGLAYLRRKTGLFF